MIIQAALSLVPHMQFRTKISPCEDFYIAPFLCHHTAHMEKVAPAKIEWSLVLWNMTYSSPAPLVPNAQL